MYRRALVLGLVVLLSASALLSVAPSHRGSIPAPVVVSPAGSITPAAVAFGIVNGFDVPATDFYPGELGAGTLCFTIVDTRDREVNVTITDPNSVLDGTGSPAFHYVAVLNTTTSSFDSYTAGVSYTFPATLAYGGPWIVNFSAPGAGTVLDRISVIVYAVDLSTSVGTGATLPGQPMSVFWSLTSVANDESLYTRATNVTITGTYTGNGTVQALFPKVLLALTPAGAGFGEWTGVVPFNATPGTQLRFEVYAETIVGGTVTENQSANVTVNVGALTIRGIGLTPSPPTCDLVNDVYFPDGTQIAGCLEAGALYRAAFTPIAGLPVTVQYWNGTAHVAPAGAPTSLTTNVSGEAGFTFLATSPPFIEESQSPRYDGLNFTVTVPGASIRYAWTQWLNATWALTGGSTASGVVQVTLDKSDYYSGDTATAVWSIHSSNLSETGAILAVSWAVYGPSSVTYAEDSLNSTAQSGTFTFAITPAMISHTIEVWVYAANATEAFAGYASASVLNPSLLLTPASIYYSAGSTTTVTAVLSGGGTGVTIQYEVMGNWVDEHTLLSNGTVANGSSIPVRVPTSTPPQSIAVDAWATVGGQVVASGSVDLLLAIGYSLQLGITTPSSYSDGSYQPGQSVTLSYQLVAVGGAALPQTVTFDLFALGYPATELIQNLGPSGTVSFTIPSNAVQGTLLVALVAEGPFPSSSCIPAGGCEGIATLPINPHPSVFNLELGAGSGITVGWLILLALGVVVVAVLALMIHRRGGRRPTASPVPGWREPTTKPAPGPDASGSPPPPPAGPS